MSRNSEDAAAAGTQAAVPELSPAEVARVSAEVMPLDAAAVLELEPLVANLRALARAVDQGMREGEGVADSVDAVDA